MSIKETALEIYKAIEGIASNIMDDILIGQQDNETRQQDNEARQQDSVTSKQIPVVIELPEELYKASQIIEVKYEDTIQIPLEVIANGTPLLKGHWIADVFVDECSVCGEQTLFFEDQQKNFCPNCGADMRADKENE